MRIVALIFAFVAAVAAAAADLPQVEFDELKSDLTLEEPVPLDSILPDEEPGPGKTRTRWIGQLLRNGFQINDPNVDYPRFPRFCVKVYNWGDRTFNHYDSTYVVPTGKNWKVQMRSFNWLENYATFYDPHSSMLLRSDVYADIGAYLSFMAVSVGYMFNANELINGSSNSRSHFNFNFTCALFNVDYLATSTNGGAVIYHLRNNDGSTSVHIPFENISHSTRSLTFNYFFNHRKYSHAAAFCYSKYQLKSAGSWLAGIYYTTQDIAMDFTDLRSDLLEFIPAELRKVRFHFADYAVNAGYGYNWVLSPRKWLLNAAYIQGLGYKRSIEDSTDGRKSMVAVNPQAQLSVVYNHKALFASAQAEFVSNFFFNSNYTFFNAMFTLHIAVGARF